MTRKEKWIELNEVLTKAKNNAWPRTDFYQGKFDDMMRAETTLGEHEHETNKLGNELPYTKKSEQI